MLASNLQVSLISMTVQELVAAGAPVNTQNSWGASALHLAARGQASRVVNVLLDNGADANRLDLHSLAPLHYAAQAGCLPALRMLLNAGANVDAETDMGATPLNIVAKDSAVDAVALLLPAGAALRTLQECWKDLSVVSKAAVQVYVRSMCLAAACSMRVCAGADGCAEVALHMDVTHCILERVLGAGEKFVRLLLDGNLEGCV